MAEKYNGLPLEIWGPAQGRPVQAKKKKKNQCTLFIVFYSIIMFVLI